MDEKQICWDLIIIDSRNSASQSRSFVASRTIKFARISSSYVPQYVLLPKIMSILTLSLQITIVSLLGILFTKIGFRARLLLEHLKNGLK